MARTTPLHDAHAALGARFVEFGGWEMPLCYAGPTEEHQAVRRCCGLFDVSHMGEIEVRGPGAAAACQALTVNDVARLRDGEGQYTLLCNESGGTVDDLIVFRLSAERYLLVVNAATTASDLDWIRARIASGPDVVDRSAELALLALQGPAAERALATVTSIAVDPMRSFTAREGRVAGRSALVSRTGYTGEDGFEVLVGAEDAPATWAAMLEACRAAGGLPAGLGARDTLRLEAALPLYGVDVDAGTTPLEAGLGWVVKLDKGEFVGREALARQAARGVARQLVGFRLDEAGVPRHGQAVSSDGEVLGTVTSGARSPTLGSFIGLALVRTRAAAPGTALAIEIRGRPVPAHVVPRPFYRRGRKES